jgi:hypothetical protein
VNILSHPKRKQLNVLILQNWQIALSKSNIRTKQLLIAFAKEKTWPKHPLGSTIALTTVKKMHLGVWSVCFADVYSWDLQRSILGMHQDVKIAFPEGVFCLMHTRASGTFAWEIDEFSETWLKHSCLNNCFDYDWEDAFWCIFRNNQNRVKWPKPYGLLCGRLKERQRVHY